MTRQPVLLCGDPHGTFDHIVQTAQHYTTAAVILLGDLEPNAPLEKELAPIVDRVWWIPGNHDADSASLIERTWLSGLRERNLHGHVVELPDGRVIAGLGGVFRKSVWMPNNNPPDPSTGIIFPTREEHLKVTPKHHRHLGGPPVKHWGSIYPQDFWRLFGRTAEMLVTHEACGYHPYGFKVVDALARAMDVSIVAHGHQHDARWRHEDQSEVWRSQGFKSIGVGLRGITMVGQDDAISVIVPGEYDRQVSPICLPGQKCGDAFGDHR